MPFSSDLERLYDEHAQALFAFLIDFTGSEHDARDLLQEVFVRLARREHLLEDVDSERGFLIRLAHNLGVDFLRRCSVRRKKQEEFAEDQLNSETSHGEADRATFEDALNGALQTLPDDQRAIVHLKLWGGATFQEIAGMLNLSPNTAASRYRYGIEKLRERLRFLYNEIQ